MACVMKSIDVRDAEKRSTFAYYNRLEKFPRFQEKTLARGILAVDTRATLSLRLTKEFGRKSQLLVLGPLIAPIYAPLLPFGRKEIRDMFIKR